VTTPHPSFPTNRLSLLSCEPVPDHNCLVIIQWHLWARCRSDHCKLEHLPT
jgi:hypothetical protein